MIRSTVIGVLVSLCPAISATEFHVATTGDDLTNPGTRDSPFASIEAARDAIRQMKSEGKVPADGVTVWIHEGTYRLDKGIHLTQEDSGTADAPISYRAVPNQSVRLSGGRTLPASIVESVQDSAVLKRIVAAARPPVVQVDLNALGISDFGRLPVRYRGAVSLVELFCNDQPMTPARWPNEGWAETTGKVIEQGSRPRFGDKPDRAGAFEYQGDRPSRWQDVEDIHLHGYWSVDWWDESIQIKSIDPEKRQITLAAPHHYGLGHPWIKDKPLRFFAHNLLEELDRPGEWHLDRKTGLLYFWPPEPLEKARITVSLLAEPVIQLEDVSHVTLQGFTVQTSRSDGINVLGGASNRITGCTVRNVGLNGIVIQHGQKHGVDHCDIYQTGTAGLVVKGGDRKTLTPATHTVADNEIHHFARLQRAYAPAIVVAGVGHRIMHNELHHAPHTAIMLLGNDHLIEFNEIHHACMETDDIGALYMGRNPSERGSVIRYNFWHHIGSPVGHGSSSMYFDDGAGGNTVFGNVFYKACDPGRVLMGAIFIHGGHDTAIENNMFVECKQALGEKPWETERWQKFLDSDLMNQRLRQQVNITKEPYDKYPELKDYFDSASKPRLNTVQRNLVYRCDAFIKSCMPNIPPSYAAQDNYITDTDPGFADSAKMDFMLRTDSPVFSEMPGFTAIPFDEIGIRDDAEGN